MQARRSRVLAAACVAVLATGAFAEPRFNEYEIRVIRPRYMIKAGHFEVAAGLATIVNQTFIYSFLATGLMTFHLSETLALEAQGAYALNVDRADKSRLNDRFAIKTILLRPESLLNGRLLWTPSYGKFHLSSARIVYFDTYLAVGGGMTGIRYLYDYCDGAAPTPRSKSYPTAVLGLGQRYFIDRSSSLRVGLDMQRVFVVSADGQCEASDDTSIKSNDNLLFFAAWSYYL